MEFKKYRDTIRASGLSHMEGRGDGQIRSDAGGSGPKELTHRPESSEQRPQSRALVNSKQRRALFGPGSAGFGEGGAAPASALVSRLSTDGWRRTR